jgi:regulator of protease activity HflC (stomatin/prohibitin superfamily)
MAYTIVKLAVVAVILVITVGIASASFQQVDAGHIGTKLTWGNVDKTPIQEGGYFVIPMYQEIVQMSIQIQKYVSDTESASKDLQSVRTQVTVNYHPLPDKVPEVYQQLGQSYEDRIINPAIEETVKQVTANFNAEELITQRPLVKAQIEEAIQNRLFINNIMVDHVSITEFTFSEKFNQVIELKVEAEQKAFKAVNDLKRIEVEAKQRIAEAYGIAESKKAIGDAEAYALSVVGKALDENPDLIVLENIKRWNGILPEFLLQGGESGSPAILLSVPTNTP